MFQKESFYWWMQRIIIVSSIPFIIWAILLIIPTISNTSFATISTVLNLFSYSSFYLLLLIGFLLSLHIRLGLEELLEDYIHDQKVKLVCSICLRILAIKMIHDLYLWSIHSFTFIS